MSKFIVTEYIEDARNIKKAQDMHSNIVEEVLDGFDFSEDEDGDSETFVYLSGDPSQIGELYHIHEEDGEPEAHKMDLLQSLDAALPPPMLGQPMMHSEMPIQFHEHEHEQDHSHEMEHHHHPDMGQELVGGLEVVDLQDPEIMIHDESVLGLGGGEDTIELMLPGVDGVIESDLHEEPEEEAVVTDWQKDRDPKQFMAYILKIYPAEIPKHDGSSTLGCERAIQFLTKLNKEISEALRRDEDNCLDIAKLEEVRVEILQGITKLKKHIKKLNEKSKKAEETLSLVKEAEIEKQASTPIIQLVMTPFERAISGILVNSVVSSGKPFEEVYEFLKKEYKLDSREELAIFQILKDMGHPIFIDRGTISTTKKKEDGKSQGVEFIKNYLA
jgi:hypothetical protein